MTKINNLLNFYKLCNLITFDEAILSLECFDGNKYKFLIIFAFYAKLLVDIDIKTFYSDNIENKLQHVCVFMSYFYDLLYCSNIVQIISM